MRLPEEKRVDTLKTKFSDDNYGSVMKTAIVVF